MQQVNWALKQFFFNLHLQFNKIQRRWKKKWKKNRTKNRKSYSTGYINYLCFYRLTSALDDSKVNLNEKNMKKDAQLNI